jgi:chorismate mutase
VKLRALRGAITCDDNTKEEIDVKTQRLMREILDRNDLDHDDLVSILFTATEDLTAEFPAAAARAIGLGDVPLICARELAVEHGMARVIRVLVHCYTSLGRADLHHVYLEGARALRDDLPE